MGEVSHLFEVYAEEFEGLNVTNPFYQPLPV